FSIVPPASPQIAVVPFHYAPPPAALSSALPAQSPSPAPIQTNRISPQKAAGSPQLPAPWSRSAQSAQTQFALSAPPQSDPAKPSFHHSIQTTAQAPPEARAPNGAPYRPSSLPFHFQIVQRKIACALLDSSVFRNQPRPTILLRSKS